MKNGSLYAVELHLLPTNDTTLPASMGAQVHASLLNLVSQFDPALSRRLHDEPDYRPYTISRLRGGKISGHTITLRRDQPCYLRVTLLDGGALWNALQIYFQGAGPISMRLCNKDFRLIRMVITSTPGANGWADSTDWHALASLPAQSTITFRFEAATAFSLGERQFCLFPEPHFVWGGLLRVWNRYAPENLHIEKQTIGESFGRHIAVTACTLRHAYLHFPKYVQKGFIGGCTYRLSEDRPLAAQLTSLAAFARYSGVGYKTTMGMGQVRVEFNKALSN